MTTKANSDGTANFKNRMLHLGSTTVGPHLYIKKLAENIRGISWETFKVDVLGVTIGAKLFGVDLINTSDKQIEEIKKAVSIYKVVVISNCFIDQDQQLQFSSKFGEIIDHPFLKSNNESKLVSFIRNKNSGGYENIWHSDLTWTDNPGMYAILNSVNMPQYGGDTLFADMHAAFESLDEDFKNYIRYMRAEHDFAMSFKSFFSDDEQKKIREIYKPVTHPLCPVHPITKNRFVYANRNFTTRILDLDNELSQKLLGRLTRLASTPEFQYRHKWSIPQLVIWDNYSVQHYAASDYWPQQRHVDRATVKGPLFTI